MRIALMGLVNALGVCTYIEAGNHLSSGRRCTILDNLLPVVTTLKQFVPATLLKSRTCHYISMTEIVSSITPGIRLCGVGLQNSCLCEIYTHCLHPTLSEKSLDGTKFLVLVIMRMQFMARPFRGEKMRRMICCMYNFYFLILLDTR